MTLDQALEAIRDYQNAFERVLKLHSPKAGRASECIGCGRKWPCPTTREALQPHETED